MSEIKTKLAPGRRIKVDEAEPDLTLNLNQGRRIDAPVTIEAESEEKLDIGALYKESKPGRKRWLTRLFVVSFAGAIGYEAVDAIISGWQSSVILGALYSLALASGLILLLRLLWKEFRSLRALKRNQRDREHAERLLNSEQVGEALPWLKKLNETRPMPGFKRFCEKLQGHFSDREIMQLYRDTLLSEQDVKARKIVKRYAVESGLLVALSPLAVVDMLAVLWRGTRLIEEISLLYGLRLGYAGRIRLYRMLVKQMLFVGAAELVSDLAATALGAELVGKLSGRAAQGISAGILTARIGQQAIILSRPLPAIENRSGLLKEVSQSLLGRLISRKENESENA